MRVKVNGIFINYELAGKGKCLALIHGLGGSLNTWHQQVAAFSERYQVLTWDVRGFGGSDRPRGEYSATLFASDLAGLLRKLSVERAYVLGHSMGGVIALRFALDHPELTAGLIVSASSSEVNPKAIEYWDDLAATVEKKGMEAVPFDPARVFSKEFGARNPDLVAAFARTRPVNDPNAYARAARAMARYNYTPELGKITCPTLVIVGDQDMVTPPGGSVIMSRRIPGSKLIIFKGLGHVSYVENPEVYNSAVLGFLAEAEKKR